MNANPLSLGVIEAPANYGATIAICDLHDLGCHLSSGGSQSGIIATPDDMKHMSETKDLAFGMVDTIKEGEYGFTLNLYERTHYVIREKGKEFTGTQSNYWFNVFDTSGTGRDEGSCRHDHDECTVWSTEDRRAPGCEHSVRGVVL